MEPSTPLLYLDCYLELDQVALETARFLNRRIVESIGGTVDFARGTIPHITLFMGLFPTTEQKRLTETISRLCQGRRSFPVRLEGLTTSREGYLFWQVLPDRDVVSFHRSLVEALNPLRHGAIRPKFLETLDQFTSIEQANIRTFGFPWVLENFSPHVTIGAVSPDKVAHMDPAIRPPQHTFFAEHLGLGPVGDSGVVLEIGTRFGLSLLS